MNTQPPNVATGAADSTTLGPTREAGVLLHIAALPGEFGIGELGAEARKFVDRIVEMQLGVWQFLPIGPTGYGDSPYQSFSTFAGNEMLIDIGTLVERKLLSDADVQPLKALPNERVDYGALIPLKTRLLKRAAKRFLASTDTALHDELTAFVARNDSAWLHDYALFRAIKTSQNERPWPEWPEALLHREIAALEQFATAHAEDIEATKVLQFLFFQQWDALKSYANGKGIRLFGDMPIYLALDSADAWANRELLRLDRDGRPDAVAGVPPDYFSEDGQLWGNPLYDWRHHADTDYSWWVRRLHATISTVDLVRIDHFRGFESYWAIPAGADTARAGVWESGPGSDLFRNLRESLGALPIVAEDLGIITPQVEALRDDNQLPGMCVLQFAVGDEHFNAADVPEFCVCYTGTHDNDTTIGWYESGAANGDFGDLTKVALETKARLVVVPAQDFLGLGSESRYNVPGQTGGNWQWRILDTQLSADFCHNVASTVKASGRGTFVNE